MGEASQTSLLAADDAAVRPVRGRIYVGTCSWAEKSFVKSNFYPRPIRTAEDRLRYYATQFPTVEIDASYFALLPPAYSRRWAEETPPGFIMHAKAFGLFTGHGAAVQRLPQGFSALLPPRLREVREVRVRDVPDEFLNACWDRYREFLAPLEQAGKLGYVLFQLPPGVKYSPAALEAMRGWKRELPGCHLAVEFRNRDWARHPEALEFLAREGLAYVMVDLPDLPRLMPTVEAITSDWAVVRFHGRNIAGWDRTGASTDERYDYEYSIDELRSWAEIAARGGSRAARFFAMFNNHVRGNMARNARTFLGLLAATGDPQSVEEPPPGPG
ncbi:MAG TPA: DUF72 domain-containing protein [bacterium]|nr:DUF72 domain-containing protein [bacterium]